MWSALPIFRIAVQERTGACAPAATPVDVLINIAERSVLSCAFPAQRSARSSVDNCWRDQAVTNARQLADLLSNADLSVVASDG
jgi:hypothetical protein